MTPWPTSWPNPMNKLMTNPITELMLEPWKCDVRTVLLPIYYFRFLHEQPFDTYTSPYYIYVYVIQHLTKVTIALNSGSTRSHQCNGDLSGAAVEVLLRVDGSATCNANAMSLGWSGGRSVAVDRLFLWLSECNLRHQCFRAQNRAGHFKEWWWRRPGTKSPNCNRSEI